MTPVRLAKKKASQAAEHVRQRLAPGRSWHKGLHVAGLPVVSVEAPPAPGSAVTSVAETDEPQNLMAHFRGLLAPSRERSVVLQASTIWLATRIFIALVTYFGVTLSSISKTQFPAHDLLFRWDRFDVNWYLMISKWGYWSPSPATFPRDGGQMPTAFFPLYPMLIRAATVLVGDAHRFAAAVVISNLGTLLGFIGVGLLAAKEEGEPGLLPTLRVLAAYPMAFFLAAAYTEGIFLALATFCLYFARRGAWGQAILCSFLAGLTRFTGIVLFLPVIFEFASQQGWLRREAWTGGRWRELMRLRTLGQFAAIAMVPPLGIATYMVYLWQRFGDPLSFAHAAQANWYHVSMPPWGSIPLALHGLRTTPGWTYQQALILIDLVPVVVFGVLTLALARRMPIAFTVYMLGLLFVTTASPVTWTPDVWVSAGRYLIPSIPLFLMLGRWLRRWPWLDFIVVGGGLALQTMLVVLWVTTNAYIT